MNDADDFAKIRVSYLNCVNLLINGSQLRFDKGQYWRDMEPNKKKIVQREVNNLLLLGAKSHDKIVAAEVQSMLSLIAVIRGDDKTAIGCLREAVTKDPDRQTDWERLTELLEATGDFKTLEALTRVRLGVADTLRTRLILTVACAEAGDDKEALAEFGRLQANYGDDARVHLLEIAMLLRRANTPKRKEVLARVGDLLKRYEDDTRDNKRDAESFTLLSGIYDAMTGKVEAARHLFTQVANADPKRADARDALAALN